jgi:Flp pilus assembly protein TadG
MHIKSIKKFPRKASGAATVEFALVAAVVFTLLFGIIDFSYIFWGTLSMQHAVREGARYGSCPKLNLRARHKRICPTL